MYKMQKTLPLVFDDSLSYYEVVCKLATQVDNLTDAVSGDFTETITDYIEATYNDRMVAAIYDAATETITFSI